MRLSLVSIALVFGFLGTARAEQNYCLALRGNGDLAPAHWGALAGVVEKLGLPRMMAGGSSASISMMFVDAAATNPAVKTPEQAALVLKSLEGFADFVRTTKGWQDFAGLFAKTQGALKSSWLETLVKETTLEDLNAVKYTLERGIALGLIGLENQKPLLYAIDRGEMAAVKFYVNEIVNAFKAFGGFDPFAPENDNLFFRPGVVDFAVMAEQFGLIADFLAQEGWADLIGGCTKAAKGRTWSELVLEAPECKRKLDALIAGKFPKRSAFVRQDAGVTIPSYPTTAVLTGRAVNAYETWLHAYHTTYSASLGRDFTLTNPDDLKFGYWGRGLDALALAKTDEKSRRFLNLGPTTWKNAISLSPAEPGLASLQEIPGTGTYSAGGWSDLHPTKFLKGMGCENVVYVTRRGGESMFAQGVAKRLLGFDRDLKITPENEIANNLGDPTDMASLWSRLYNLANPRSSFRQALDAADVVLCTNWNGFDIKNGYSEMIKEAYRAPYFVRGEFGSALTPRIDVKARHASGYPLHAGCF
ncbi:MAG TPA: hypothetical protein PKC28_08765 [Bdellovibrionales bacterium]|nr:hypothetical protein [Bdellovibrionales bacterium]